MDPKETKIYSAILITSFILGCIIVFFVVSIIRHQRRNQKLYKSKIVAEITALEKERARIAADLHDDLGPILSAVKLRINILDISADNMPSLDKINMQIDDIIQRMREISNDLMPQNLLTKGLVIAIEDFINTIPRPTNLEITFRSEQLPPLSADKSINLYRIVQESVHNAIKHARANQLDLRLSCKKNTIIFIAKDNGRGFDYRQNIIVSSGLGLRNLLSRTEIMNGYMFIESKPGEGTKYMFEIPI